MSRIMGSPAGEGKLGEDLDKVWLALLAYWQAGLRYSDAGDAFH